MLVKMTAGFLRNYWTHCWWKCNKTNNFALNTSIKNLLIILLSTFILPSVTTSSAIAQPVGSNTNFNFATLPGATSNSNIKSNNYNNRNYFNFLVQKIRRPLENDYGQNYINNNNLDLDASSSDSSSSSKSPNDNPDAIGAFGNIPLVDIEALQIQPYHHLQLDCRHTQGQGCNLYEITELIATPSGPKFKRSIDANTDLGPTIRVFKYITETDQLQNYLQEPEQTVSLEENSIGNFERKLKNKSKLLEKPTSSKVKKHKNAKKSSKQKGPKSDYIKKVDLRVPSVTDRSLIRNSYFASDLPTQNDDSNLFSSDNHNYYNYNNNHHHIQHEHTNATIATTNFINAITSSSTSITTTDATTTTSITTTTTAPTTTISSTTESPPPIVPSIEATMNFHESSSSKKNTLENAFPNAATEHKVTKKQGRVKGRVPTAAEFLELFNASLSERSRRSPFRYPQLYPMLYQQNVMQQQQKQFQQYQQQQIQQQMQRFPQLQQANRAALYLRNGNPMPNNGANNNPAMKPPHQQFQNKQKQSIRMTSMPMNGPNNKIPQQSFPTSPQLKSQLMPPPSKGPPDLLQTSGSNDHFTYRPPNIHFPHNVAVALPPPNLNFNSNDPNLIPEHTWNHPMYRRYSKAAKRVQNYFGSTGPNDNKERRSQGRKDFRPERPSGSKPIPLPRPRPRDNNNKGRRIRTRNKGRPQGPGGPDGPGIRYSYPKSAQNIQDILNHFQRDNNDIFDGMKHKKSSSDHHHRGGNNLPPGPSISDDLSDELNDVRFSLMRDIREFSKRPSILSQDDPRPISLRSPSMSHSPSSPSHRNGNDVPNHILDAERDDDPIPIPKPPTYYREESSSSQQHSYNSGDKHSSSYRADQISKKNSHRNKENDPHSPNYNHEDGFDEIFNPKPKPVREMIKASSKFRQEMDRDNSREREFQHSKKRNRPFRESFRDRDDENGPSGGNNGDGRNKGFMDSSPPKFYSDNTINTKQRKYGSGLDDESPERYREDQYSSSSSNKNDRPSRHPQESSMEMRHRDRNRNRERDNRDRDRHHHTSKEEMERDREHSYKGERPKRIRTKFRDEDFPSSFERNPYHSPRERNRESNSHRERELPKSIRDKIREASLEYDSQKSNREPNPLSSYRATNKPLVLKRPYEPYRIPPQVFQQPDLDHYGPSINKKQSPINMDPEFWPHFSTANEKSSYGFKKPGGIIRPPLVLATPASGMPYSPQFMSPSAGAPSASSSGGALSSPEDEDVLEIHTGGVGPLPVIPTYQGHDPIQEKSLQKAYLELLQHKMQAESALLNPTSHHHHTKPKKAPMRMKIHIYPNNEGGSSNSGSELSSINPNLNNFANFNYGGGTGYSSGSHPSSMVSSPPQKIGGSIRSQHSHHQQHMNSNNMNMNHHGNNHHLQPGPAPPPPTGYGNSNNGGSNGNGNGANGNKPAQASSSISEKNKNLVLHLHVHRRNDVGPVELEAEGSELHPSTVKPLTFKDIFDEQQQQQNQEQQTGGGGEPEPDKSVSMEVPIHDDKIEDVLHTLLQFRDRGSARKKRNHTASSDTSNPSDKNSKPTSKKKTKSKSSKKTTNQKT